MSKKAFSKIAAGLEDAIAFQKGETARGRVAAPLNFVAVRAATKKTQVQFAKTYRIPVATVRDWEQQRRQPDATARVLLSMIQADPEGVERILAKAEASA